MSGFVLQSIEATADPGFVLESIAAGAAMTLVTAIDAGNVSQSLTTIDDPFAAEPVVTLMNRSAAGDWRHLLFALDDAEGKRPLFKAPRSTRYTNGDPTVDYRPVWTQDFQTWHRAPSRQLVGGGLGTIEWQFSDSFPPGRVYVATQPLGRQIDATYLAQELLTDYPAICAPVSSADAQGVFFTSPAETDENGRAIGAHPLYGLKLRFGGATTDGGPKRRLVMIAGIHAAGEATSWLPFVHCTRWMLDSISMEAAAFRSNWDVDLYFNITPNGLYGGSNRRNFRSGLDTNRIWNAPNVEIGATQSAILSEIGGGRFDAFYSWHSWSSSSSPFLCYVTPYQESAASRSPVMQAMIDAAGALFGVSASVTSSGTYNTDAWWAEQQGCPVSFDTEVQQNGSTDPVIYQTIGETWAKTLQAVDADGWFVTAVSPTGTLAAQEAGADTAAMSGAVLVAGALSATESGADTAIIIGGNILAGYMAAQEAGSDTAAASGAVVVSGAMAASETGADGFAASGSIGNADIIGNVAALESGADSIVVSGVVIVSGSMAAAESGSDTMQTDNGEWYPSSRTISVPSGRTITLRPR